MGPRFAWLLGLAVAVLASCYIAASPDPGVFELVPAESRIGFTGVKNENVEVPGSFSDLSGELDLAERNARVEIPIASLQTGDEERDQNLRTHLFELGSFPKAVVKVEKLPHPDKLPAAGKSRDYRVEVVLELHGQRAAREVGVRVTHDRSGRLRIQNPEPVIVSAEQLGLEKRFAILQAVCGHQSLARSVPITVDLVFDPATSR